MFGIIRPCGDHSCPSLHRAWMAHLCGLCLTLRDGQGHGARLATNYDGLIISVLAEAQRPAGSPHRTAGPCALRGFRSADVVDARAEGVRLAATVSLVLAAGKLRDHVADGDSAPGTGLARRKLASRWEASGLGWGRRSGRHHRADLRRRAPTRTGGRPGGRVTGADRSHRGGGRRRVRAHGDTRRHPRQRRGAGRGGPASSAGSPTCWTPWRTRPRTPGAGPSTR